ncbi:FtsX-like permease family protein [Actinoplanes sp. NPDC020271]|uniref:FtsX-like permease family protein n=1 Tax=Actinoplanes sp. NPDC020271 TaxID=3363896 RepID=UPI0037BDCA29
MISLILTMVWARRGPAIVLAVLAAFAVAPAVAAPAYLRAADRVVAAGQVAHAERAEKEITIRVVDPDRREPGGNSSTGGIDIATTTGQALAELPGFRYAYAAEIPTVGLETDSRFRTRLVHRQDACAHLVIVAGRCLLGEGDLVLGEQAAQRLKLVVGQSVDLTYAYYNADPAVLAYVADGIPKSFFLAGTYRVADPGDVYWGEHGYFTTEDATGGTVPGEPAFTGLTTFDLMDRGKVQLSVDGYAGPGALDADRLPALRAALTRLQAGIADVGAGLDNATTAEGLQLQTGIPKLLARIDEGHTTARRIVPVPAVALVVLACLAILLAVAAGAEVRRPEIAVIALRGSRQHHRWLLATGESLVAVLAGTIAGALAGQLLVDAVVAIRWPGVGADPHPDSLRYAPLAAAAAVLAVLLAQGVTLLRPVTELLRRAPVPGRWAGITVDILIVALAAGAAVQLAVGGGDLVGIGSAAPALVMLALALLVARALRPAAARLGHRALGRGRLGPGLTWLMLSRRGATGRVLALLVAAVAVSAYMVAASDVAAHSRRIQADLGVGADRVLSVGAVGRAQLLTAVHRADPDARYAMAAVVVPQRPDQPPVLAVDTPRLAAVANWPGGTPYGKMVDLLRPETAKPVVTAGAATFTLDLSADGFRPGRMVSVDAILSPVDGSGPDVVAPMGVPRPGRHTYTYPAPQCKAEGCRLNALHVSGANTLGVQGVLTLHGLGGTDPAGWRVSPGGRAVAGADGLRLELTNMDNLPEGLYLQPVDTPWPLPAVATGTFAPGAVNGFDFRPARVTIAGRLPAIPQIGGPALMVDLEYADRLATDGNRILTGQVWLSPRAPADMVDRLAAQGLTFTGDLRSEQLAARLAQQGAAVALGYGALVAVLVALLAAGVLVITAAAGRERQVEDLTVLRTQGLSRAAVRRAALWSYPALALAAVPAGLVIAVAGWAATGWALPLSGLNPPPLPLPSWPGVISLLLAAVALAVLLGGTALLAGRRTLRRVP